MSNSRYTKLLIQLVVAHLAGAALCVTACSSESGLTGSDTADLSGADTSSDPDPTDSPDLDAPDSVTSADAERDGTAADPDTADVGAVLDSAQDGDTGFDVDADTDLGGADFEDDTVQEDMAIADLGESCEGVECPALFERCVGGGCELYPPCDADDLCADIDEVCVASHCVPGGADLDGDGFSASEDCDDTDYRVNPGAREVCGPTDDNCDDDTDNGDPAVLCADNPGGGLCVEGSCGCPFGTYDLDPLTPGCECVGQEPEDDQGLLCGTAVDLGTLDDSGQTTTITGNHFREVWYRFRAVDLPDSSCDNLHVRVHFVANPGNIYAFAVTRRGCAVDDSALTDFVWAVDFPMTDYGVGECPCTAPGEPTEAGVNLCRDNSADFFIVVRRRPFAPQVCESYEIEVSNGVYDT